MTFMKTKLAAAKPVAGKLATAARRTKSAVVAAVLIPHASILVAEVGGQKNLPVWFVKS